MTRGISPERRTAYNLGLVLMVIGILLFGSVFVTFAMHFGDFDNFHHVVRSSMIRAVLGMGLMIGGAVLRGIGAAGLAGSGVVLDPDQARQDLEPFSRMAGGMVKDALNEADIKVGSPAAPQRIVVLKCRQCGKLNPEDAKFCQECGKSMA